MGLCRLSNYIPIAWGTLHVTVYSLPACLGIAVIECLGVAMIECKMLEILHPF